MSEPKLRSVKAKEPEEQESGVRGKWRLLHQQVRSAFLEREREATGLLVALLANENVVLLGPPGTAKSALARTVAGAVGGVFFQRLLTRFSKPEELFGPISLRALQEDRYCRVTRGKLPEANVVFIDECFKANSSILNSLLGVLNERTFDNDAEDGQPVRTPIRCVIGASNELPDGDGLEALYDRFLLRYWCDYVADARSVVALLTGRATVEVEHRVTLADLDAARDEAALLDASGVVDLLMQIKMDLERSGRRISDRRWVQVVRALRAYAWLLGDDVVTADHVGDLLPDMLWREPKDRVQVRRQVARLANPLAARVQEILDAALAEAAKVGQVDPEAARDNAKRLEAANLITSVNVALDDAETKLKELDPRGTNIMVQSALAQVRTKHEESSRVASRLLRLR